MTNFSFVCFYSRVLAEKSDLSERSHHMPVFIFPFIILPFLYSIRDILVYFYFIFYANFLITFHNYPIKDIKMRHHVLLT